MRLNKILKNTLLVLTACLVLSACATKKEVATDIQGQMQGDVYTGTDTVEYLADGVPDRVFFATNESILTTASRETLRAQAAWLRKNPKGYGTKEVIEGNKPSKGSVVTVLEDVTTTGSSAIKAVNVLRDAGYIVNRVIAIVDRQENHKVWENNEIEFISLYKLEDIIE